MITLLYILPLYDYSLYAFFYAFYFNRFPHLVRPFGIHNDDIDSLVNSNAGILDIY